MLVLPPPPAAKRAAMEAARGVPPGGKASSPVGTAPRGGATEAADIEDMVLQEKAMREAFNNIQVRPDPPSMLLHAARHDTTPMH